MQPTQIIGQVSMKEVLQRTQKKQIHLNNYPCHREMKIDTIKESKKINCVMCS
jgi:hypothetical protein